jgi:diphosphomevalonate decarboxylase
MSPRTATALAHPNIALVKYWGKRDAALNLPAVPSLSLTLDGFATTTTVRWGAAADRLVLGGVERGPAELRKVSRVLDLGWGGADRPGAEVTSENNFPTAAGLASSSSAFAALALAAAAAAGQPIDRARLSVIARQGSGSACRSLWGGFVEWRMGARADGTDSHGVPVAPADHWDLRLVVAVVSAEKKAVGSTDGMTRTAQTCPLFPGFVSSAPADVDQARSAVLARDLPLLGAAMERSTNKMHATMIATEPTVRYWKPVSVAVLDAVEAMRADGLSCYSTMDAGPNVKVLCATADAERVAATLRAVPGLVRVEVLAPGGDARLIG